jgi:mannose-1-phosphate guanylyltransferase
VERFVEKPSTADAAALAERGALWNSFVFAARGETLLTLYVRRQPALLDDMVGVVLSRRPAADRAEALRDLYARLESRDFSRDVLEGNESALVVLRAPACGWTDLGTPERLERCLSKTGARGAVRTKGRPGGRARAAVPLPALA